MGYVVHIFFFFILSPKPDIENLNKMLDINDIDTVVINSNSHSKLSVNHDTINDLVPNSNITNNLNVPSHGHLSSSQRKMSTVSVSQKRYLTEPVLVINTGTL